jgi:hypothetical protein
MEKIRLEGIYNNELNEKLHMLQKNIKTKYDEFIAYAKTNKEKQQINRNYESEL